jgi:hypothetical protein
MIESHDGETMLLGLFNGDLHRPSADDLTKTMVSRDYSDNLGVFRNSDLSSGMKLAPFKPMDVFGDTNYSVRIMTCQIGLREDLTDNVCLILGHPIGGKNGTGNAG